MKRMLVKFVKIEASRLHPDEPYATGLAVFTLWSEHLAVDPGLYRYPVDLKWADYVFGVRCLEGLAPAIVLLDEAKNVVKRVHRPMPRDLRLGSCPTMADHIFEYRDGPAF